MTGEPEGHRRGADAARARQASGLDRGWARSLGLTLALIGLVAAAIGADRRFTLVALASSAVGFGFFYGLFPGGLHFALTVANFLAIYACLFVFFREANFAGASDLAALVALILPVATFLGACFWQRQAIGAAIRARRLRELVHLPRLTRWVPMVLAVCALSFAWPDFRLSGEAQGMLLVGSMAAVSATVAFAVRDVVLLLIDVALIFEDVAARLNRLVMPVMAFLTFYSLLVVVFACLYRIAQGTMAEPQFVLHGAPHRISFAEAVYFSVITIATVGYGDFAPSGALVRVVAAAEVVAGLLLLLFGFSEIMRSAGPDAARGRPAQRREVPPHARLGNDLSEARRWPEEMPAGEE